MALQAAVLEELLLRGRSSGLVARVLAQFARSECSPRPVIALPAVLNLQLRSLGEHPPGPAAERPHSPSDRPR
ncbi:MAG: hypothetical protein JO168_07865 [Solirubrobacterales bacterium]|nr:hypothetical protein [Solirubrobacterales bacterium]MBV9715909.1 hypothetical protein [Solirubrobacterales bacterium]